MKYKHIQAAHEIRMWIGQVIVPAIIGMVTLYSNPQTREFMDEKKCDVKNKLNSVFKKN